jgi:hypothetical protein
MTTQTGRLLAAQGLAAALAACGALAAGSAFAQEAPVATAGGARAPVAAVAAPAAVSEPAPSEVMALNLIRLLVKQGVITQAQADALIREAQAETEQAKQAKLAAAEPPPPAAGVLRIPYVPQVVRDQIRDDLKKDVLAEAKAEGWATPNAVPSWVNQIEFFGDVRFQDQFNWYDKTNVSPYIDYATFNNNGPIDINAATNVNGLPYLNTLTDRLNQLIIRARIGATFHASDKYSMTVRLATGNDNGPVSTTQLLTNSLTKTNIWLDQAYLTMKPVNWFSADLGRAPNRFMHTQLVFSDSLNLDGVQAGVRHGVLRDGLDLFAEGGAIPLGYVPSSFPTNNGAKAPDSTKWLFAAQAGLNYQPNKDGWSARAAVSYYDYDNVRGQLSAPCAIYAGERQCSTDSSRPAYMQKGNTLFLIRDIIPDPASPTNYSQPQFVGLSYNYRELDFTAALEAPLFGRVGGQITGDYVRNLAYDPSRVLNNPSTIPVTNFDVNTNPGAYRSGATAFGIEGSLGILRPKEARDWLVTFGYKYTEPDAVIDAFNDYDFHLGGTNAKGYYVTGSYYFAHNSWADFRWYSANAVFGPPLAIDVLMLELNTRF